MRRSGSHPGNTGLDAALNPLLPSKRRNGRTRKIPIYACTWAANSGLRILVDGSMPNDLDRPIKVRFGKHSLIFFL